MPENNNPLSRFFRQPAIYLRLPSDGRGWPAGSLELPANGELPILPMTAIDEITYRTPDALFNGEAVVSVIESCVPSIKDAWAVPVTDLDSILIAIRIASYGHEMEVDTQCPSCETETTFGVDLRKLLDGFKGADYTTPLVIGDLTVSFRPLDYRQVNANSQVQFENQKNLQAMQAAELPEETRLEQVNAMMKKIMEITVHAIADSIAEIRTPNSIVTESEFILEFLANCERNMFSTIKDHAISLREKSDLKPLKMRCPNCQHQYEQAFTLDMARFFESAS
jgi:hypothetical protein